jgi:glycerophosphoryl diester phosphodiesterase
MVHRKGFSENGYEGGHMILRITLCMALSLVMAGSAVATQACAHRGDKKVTPENTLPAFQSAVEKNVPMIEFDVQMTRDGRLVIMHDGTVDRTTNGKGNVADLTFDEIRALDAGSWFNEKFKGTQVPTLEETLEVIPKTILCNVHLKKGPKLAAATAVVLRDMDRLDHCFLACTVEQATEAKAVVPEVKICNMSRQGRDRRAYVDNTIEMGAEFIQISYVSGLDGLNEDVERLHTHGVTVNFFGAQEEGLIRTLAAAGIDYILTDDLDLCQQVLASIEK